MYLVLNIVVALLVILVGYVLLLPAWTIKANLLFIIQKLDSFMTKPEFLQAIADFKTEIGTVSGKVDALETLINNKTDVDPEIVTAFQDLKSSMDGLNSKADNTPAA